jgi:acylphosphatase
VNPDARRGNVGMRRLVAERALDVELAALVWLLADRGVPVVVASRDHAAAEEVAAALPAVSGTLLAGSLDEVARLGGGSASAGIPDELRDLGIVIVADRRAGRTFVAAVHYVRPLERDVGGHIQRRGPAVLAAWDEREQRWEHFAWAIAPELAERAGMPLPAFETERAALVAAFGAASR